MASESRRAGGMTPLMGVPAPSPRRRLLGAGFAEPDRALRALEDRAIADLLNRASGEDAEARDRLIDALGDTADPDLALLSLLRLAAALAQEDDPTAANGLVTALRAVVGEPVREGAGGGSRAHADRLLAVLGASQALGDFLVSHPDHLDALSPERAWNAPGQPDASLLLVDAAREALAAHAGADHPAPAGPADPAAIEAATAAMRRAYYDRLLAIAADDLVSTAPAAHVGVVGAAMADLADAALEAALLIARAGVGAGARRVAFAVIAMGKAGGRELNYISDVDVIHVVGPAAAVAGTAEEPDEAELVRVGTEIAGLLRRATSASGTEPSLWPLDTGLRPEGKDGALVRTLASHVAYYERWASSWEFQALLKARAAAGDPVLGRAYEEAIAPFIWSASSRPHFVDDARAMRRRVERESQPVGEDRRIKLGPGGLRDVEFTVQLLQLVHGRADAELRVRSTLDALAALSVGGYVGRDDALALDEGYRELRLLEHRAQLHRLRRTHDLPERDADLRRIGRGIGIPDPGSLRTAFRTRRRQVRALHEEIYYRPLLGAAAALSADEMRLSPQAARDRLAAVGYLDPDGALRHIQALTEGISRRAAIQRQLLPVIIGWIGEGPDPDNGLLGFRRLSDDIGTSHWYLGLLRDSPVAAQRLCQVVSGARWTTDRLAERPEAVAWLDDDAELAPRSGEQLREEITRILARRGLEGATPAQAEARSAEAVRRILGVRTRELLRAALADSLDGVNPARTARILTNTTDAVIEGALRAAIRLVVAQRGQRDEAGGQTGSLARHSVIAMGRLGGEETTYASDADVIFLHAPRTGVDERAAAREGDEVARATMRLLASGPHPLAIDAGLRPEGRQGALSRSLASAAEYYGSWSAVWERQALLRARACAGDTALGEEFLALIAPLRWSADGLGEEELRQIRRLKARMEAERLPRGADPARHLKLGPGGLSDVEWVAQVLQLAHAHEVSGLRTTSTLEALMAAAEAELLPVDDAGVLMSAWILATRIRAATVLGVGRDSGARVDILPSDERGIRLVGRLLGLASGSERDLEDLYRRSARHARAVVERVLRSAGGGPGLLDQPEQQGKWSRRGSEGARPTAPGAAGGTPPGQAGRAGQAVTPGRASSSRSTSPRWRARRRDAGPYPWS
ncbi:bifunctional [glutamine synthetase] adenylyltransferase/[glutamine synthetase]-adenylyl-L-tyrosine phosphorylase [Actinomyces sp. zg296]|uniref:bifunctional [glutamine synthetase] adenylyltransferase/[glutamine synthetase]-adenylyl-L-tyrosine phosphorylase n=1 Tax=Actinomyces sp. zg296 TaxID=2609289 RepID=UPI00135B7170|nr:bifunctional [glutamine synthetase] adenylyltransferase/[glutamine synthetase]-adenylyl-L-tyrosine phosphorylase [Actinomyces sp. zg296]